jgi:hypothetical protein
LLLSGTSKNGRATFRVPINARLRTAINGELPGSKGSASEVVVRTESALSPREMQARLRAGASVESVAKAAGVSLERVDAFFGPVLSERIQVLDAAQSSTMTRARWGDSTRPLGDSVIANLAKVAGLREETINWTARRRNDGCWIVRVDFIARGRRRAAEWEWEPRERVVSALDTTATTLGYVEPRGGAPGRRKTAARKTSARTTTSSRKKTSTTKTTRKKTARKKTARTATAKAKSRR